MMLLDFFSPALAAELEAEVPGLKREVDLQVDPLQVDPFQVDPFQVDPLQVDPEEYRKLQQEGKNQGLKKWGEYKNRNRYSNI